MAALLFRMKEGEGGREVWGLWGVWGGGEDGGLGGGGCRGRGGGQLPTGIRYLNPILRSSGLQRR